MTSPDAWLDRAATERELAAGEVVILATDTLPGLHARLDRPDALARILKLKHRSAGSPLLVLAGSVAQAQALVAPVSSSVNLYIGACWPGPFTLILKAVAPLPSVVLSTRGTIAIRVPDDLELCRLLNATGPLASTSANVAGDEPPVRLVEAAERFPGLPAWRREPPTAAGTASTLIDLSAGLPELIRAGALAPPDWPRST